VDVVSRRPTGSALLHGISRLVSRPLLAVVVVAADIVWVVYSTVVGFPSRLETIFQTMVGALTLALVFVIQHTQAREQLVTQRKLDELLRALPHADNALIAFEEASDDELASTHHSHRRLRAAAIDPPPLFNGTLPIGRGTSASGDDVKRDDDATAAGEGL
jgi:low affinity Fe/Cu permease